MPAPRTELLESQLPEEPQGQQVVVYLTPGWEALVDSWRKSGVSETGTKALLWHRIVEPHLRDERCPTEEDSAVVPEQPVRG